MGMQDITVCHWDDSGLFFLQTCALVRECLGKAECRRRETSLFYEGEFRASA